MTLYIILGIIGGLFLFSIIIFYYEAKHAPLIPDTEPFLRGDYVPKEDELVKHAEIFCKNCKFFDGTATCLHENNFGLVTNHSEQLCKKESLFETK